jgi:hypothetical protein
MDDTYYEWKRGETLAPSLYTTMPGVDANTPFRAVAKKVRSATSPPPEQSEEIAFTAPHTFIPAAGDTPARWKLLVPASKGHELELGTYLLEAVIGFGTEIEITETVPVRLVESVSGGFEP